MHDSEEVRRRIGFADALKIPRNKSGVTGAHDSEEVRGGKRISNNLLTYPVLLILQGIFLRFSDSEKRDSCLSYHSNLSILSTYSTFIIFLTLH